MRKLALSIALGGYCLNPLVVWANDDEKPHGKSISHAPSSAAKSPVLNALPTGQSKSAQHDETAETTHGENITHGVATPKVHKTALPIKNLSDHIHVSNPKNKPALQSDDSLLEAQQKLEALIKAAIGHPSIRKTGDFMGPGDVAEPQNTGLDPHAKQPHYCIDQDSFTIGPDSRVEDYSALVSLKNSIIVGPDQVDIKQVKSLVLAYIGLGFGDEAQDFSDYLGGYDRQVLTSMGRAVSGLVRKHDVKVLSRQAKCWPEAKIWVEFTKVQLPKGYDDLVVPLQSVAVQSVSGVTKTDHHGSDVDHHDRAKPDEKRGGQSSQQDGHDTAVNGKSGPEGADIEKTKNGPYYPSKDDIKQMDALPKTLAGLMAKRFGLHAIRHGNLDSVAKMMDFLNGKHKRKGIAHIFDQEADFLQANWFLTQNNPRAVTILTRLSQRDGSFQVPSLKLLSTLKIEKGQALYSGFEQDLEGAAHIFEHHPEGKEVLAQKINLFIANDHIDEAIGMTKEKFEPDEYHYGASALRASERLQFHLKSDHEERKLRALNTLIREQIFFDALIDGFPLKSAGVGASLDLGLAELAPKILSPQHWSKLDLHILQEMALALPDELKTHLPQKAFDTDEIRAQKIASQLLSGHPKSALRELSKDPTNTVLVRSAADHSFQKGYWSMARDTIKTLQSAEMSHKETVGDAGDDHTQKTDATRKLSSSALQVKVDLAAALSVPSPHLTAKSGAQTIGDLAVLQTFLEGDLKMMKGYINHE